MRQAGTEMFIRTLPFGRTKIKSKTKQTTQQLFCLGTFVSLHCYLCTVFYLWFYEYVHDLVDHMWQSGYLYLRTFIGSVWVILLTAY